MKQSQFRTNQLKWKNSSQTQHANSKKRYFCVDSGRIDDQNYRLQDRMYKEIYKNDVEMDLELVTKTRIPR